MSGSESATPGSLRPCGLDLSPAEERLASPVAPGRSRARPPHSDVAGSVDSEILLKEVLRQHVTLAAHNPSDNQG